MRYVKGSVTGHAVPSGVFHGQRTAQRDNPQGCAIVANINVGTPMAELCNTRLLEAGYVVCVGRHVFGAAGTWNLIDIPGEAAIGAYNHTHHAKDDAMVNIKCSGA